MCKKHFDETGSIVVFFQKNKRFKSLMEHTKKRKKKKWNKSYINLTVTNCIKVINKILIFYIHFKRMQLFYY